MSERQSFTDIVAAVHGLSRMDLIELKTIVDARLTRLMTSGPMGRPVGPPQPKRGQPPQGKANANSKAKAPAKAKAPPQISRYLNVPEYRAYREAQKAWFSVIRPIRRSAQDREGVHLTDQQQELKNRFDEARQRWLNWKIAANLATPRNRGENSMDADSLQVDGPEGGGPDRQGPGDQSAESQQSVQPPSQRERSTEASGNPRPRRQPRNAQQQKKAAPPQ